MCNTVQILDYFSQIMHALYDRNHEIDKEGTRLKAASPKGAPRIQRVYRA